MCRTATGSEENKPFCGTVVSALGANVVAVGVCGQCQITAGGGGGPSCKETEGRRRGVEEFRRVDNEEQGRETAGQREANNMEENKEEVTQEGDGRGSQGEGRQQAHGKRKGKDE